MCTTYLPLLCMLKTRLLRFLFSFFQLKMEDHHENQEHFLVIQHLLQEYILY